MSDARAFLTAEWKHLLMLNYPVEPAILEPFVPAGTVLDTYQGKTYVSLVAFLFLRARLLGFPVPFHQDFEEVNLRLYVRRFDGMTWRRGVVFVKELVSKPAVALVARRVYSENYRALPMRHEVHLGADGSPTRIRFGWRHLGRWNEVEAHSAGQPREPSAGSLEEFITEHYWGYVRAAGQACLEYRVDHPRWRVTAATDVSLDCDISSLYGTAFTPALSLPPASSFLAEGSVVTVFQGSRLQ